MATRYKMVNDERIELSAEENKIRDAEEKVWSDGEKDRNLAQIRSVRLGMLQETDYFGMSDVTMSSDMKTYRQALRDLPSGKDTVDKCNNATWPTKP